MTQEAPCSIRDFRMEDAEAVHRWFNNREATRTLMEQREKFEMENAEGWTRAAMKQEGEDRKYAILVPGIEQPVGFTALYGLFRQTAPGSFDPEPLVVGDFETTFSALSGHALTMCVPICRFCTQKS